ncbi:hypothetical protein CHRY9393_02330 [Chryseobacterium fistulae]|uniref:Transposase n=1 Tax=Chryseobacterium fistulae TaxID=2675058 RepID=A0A6N4XS45_9FLAO|nr:hypothetical protein CHRY9393_02330 [Chryseobacterium fistulae]
MAYNLSLSIIRELTWSNKIQKMKKIKVRLSYFLRNLKKALFVANEV